MIVAVALVLALVAGGAAYLYLRNVQARAYHNAKLTHVYVATQNIARGTSAALLVSDGLVKQAEIPEQFKPVDAVTDLATLQGQVAEANLAPGEVLASGLFTSPVAAYSTASAAIPKGDVAITVSVDPVHDVAGLVQPGDEVDVMVEINNHTERFLYQDVPVLAVGSTVSQPTSAAPAVASATPTTTPPASSGSGLITFAVPPPAAERIAFAESGGGGVSGSLYLALVPPNNHPKAQPAISHGNFIPARVTPG